MEQHVSEVMAKSQFQQLTLQEVLESYNHIQLTEDETTEGMIWAKRKKEQLLEQQKVQEREQLNRKFFLQKTNYDLVKGIMMIRMKNIFEKEFIIDDDNRGLFDLLCLYFGEDRMFVAEAEAAGIENASLDKGILLAGNFGVGKSWMMKLFCKNHRQCYKIFNAKDIAADYKERGEEALQEIIDPFKAAFDDATVFYQKKIGLYVDDIGTEDVKNSYGNKKNVIGDLIEMKYFKETCGVFFHGSTNLTAAQLNEYYGGRITSRMREIFNVIEVKGSDRRK